MHRMLILLLTLLLVALGAPRVEARDGPPEAPARMADATRVTQRNFRIEIQGKQAGGAATRVGRLPDGGTLMEGDFVIKIQRGNGDETDVFVIKQYSLEYYDKSGALRWSHTREDEAGVKKTVTVRYDDEQAHIRFRGPASKFDRSLKLPAKHDGGLRVFRRLKQAFAKEGAGKAEYVKLDAENQVFEPVTMTLAGKTKVEHGEKTIEGWTVHTKDNTGPSTMVMDDEYLPMRGNLLGMVELVWVDESPFEFDAGGWQITSYIPVKGVAPMDEHLTSLEVTIKAPKDKEAAKKDGRPLFRTTRYQKAEQVGDDWKLTLRSTRPAEDIGTVAMPVPIPVEHAAVKRYLAPTPQSQSDDPTIVAKAKEILGDTKDARIAVAKIVFWVYSNLDKRGGARGNATAVEVLKSCVGDCSEHAALTVALCRAAGIPARNVGGIEYLTLRDGSGVAGFHAWSEVWLGRWIGVDATIPEVGTAARYILMDIAEPGESTEHDTGMRAMLGGLELHIDAYTPAGGKRVEVKR